MRRARITFKRAFENTVLGYVIIVFLFSMSLFAGQINFKLVKTIGDERENYTFFNIFGAAESESGDIFIADGRGHFIAKYDRQGKFKKRIGQKGQGPGDFCAPDLLNIYNNKLFVNDGSNFRIVVLDLDLNILSITKHNFSVERRLSDNFYVIDENRFLGNLTFINDVIRNVSIIDKTGKVTQMIFDKFPIEHKKKTSQITDRMSYLNYMGLSKKSIALDRDNKDIFISFKRPQNPIEFYVYDFKGKLKKNFTHQIEKKYEFPYYNLKNINSTPKHSCEFGVDSVFSFRGHYIVCLVQFEKRRDKTIDDTCKLLIFNKNGDFKHEEILEERYRFFHLSNKGYFLGKNFDAEIEKLYIFQLEL